VKDEQEDECLLLYEHQMVRLPAEHRKAAGYVQERIDVRI